MVSLIVETQVSGGIGVVVSLKYQDGGEKFVDEVRTGLRSGISFDHCPCGLNFFFAFCRGQFIENTRLYSRT